MAIIIIFVFIVVLAMNTDMNAAILFSLGILALYFLSFFGSNVKKRSRYIMEYEFPESIQEKLAERYPDLGEYEVQHALSALKSFFIVCNGRKGQMISMPSHVVDVAWHEFILHTHKYKEFCDHGLGGFLHHVPANEMKSRDDMTDGLGRCWRLSCDLEDLDHRSPSRLPLLFAIDEQLRIPDGYTYTLDQGIKGRYGNIPENHELSSSCAGGGGCGGGCGGGGC